MGWSIGYDDHWKRDVGYGVPAFCDHPGCDEEIDRGLAYVCGHDVYGGEHGCGLFFCGKHRSGAHSLCERCKAGAEPFAPRPEHPRWIHHKLTDPSWQGWREDHPRETAAMAATTERKESHE